jgi:nicotinamidase-related amidase
MRHAFHLLIGIIAIGIISSVAVAADEKFALTLRLRVETKGEFKIDTKQQSWPADKTAVIVCDMWDAHHCLNAVRREEEMVPRMNEFLIKARSHGALIIHAPSSCMDAYKDHAARKRGQSAPKAKNLPKDIDQWCRQIPSEEKGKYPIDQSDGGEDDDPREHEEWHAKLKAMGRNPKAPWKSQHAGLTIKDEDAISDSGSENWNLLEERGINNVMLVGVHTNMCVLGRPFGLRQMAKNGKTWCSSAILRTRCTTRRRLHTSATSKERDSSSNTLKSTSVQRLHPISFSAARSFGSRGINEVVGW